MLRTLQARNRTLQASSQLSYLPWVLWEPKKVVRCVFPWEILCWFSSPFVTLAPSYKWRCPKMGIPWDTPKSSIFHYKPTIWGPTWLLGHPSFISSAQVVMPKQSAPKFPNPRPEAGATSPPLGLTGPMRTEPAMTSCSIAKNAVNKQWGFGSITHIVYSIYIYYIYILIEGSLEVKLPTIWTDEKQSREEAERRERLEERRVEEKESEERRYRCAKR